MASMFIKFEFNKSVKKIKMVKEQMNWATVCSLIQSTFQLQNRQLINLSYKDLEGDDITVSSDYDLTEAFEMHQKKNGMKFIVNYNGQLNQTTNFSMLNFGDDHQKPKFRNVSSAENNQVPLSSENQKQKFASAKSYGAGNNVFNFKVNSSGEQDDMCSQKTNYSETKEKAKKIELESQALCTFLDDLMKDTIVREKMQVKLNQLINAKDNDDEYSQISIETDTAQVGKHLISVFNELLTDSRKSSTKSGSDKKIEQRPFNSAPRVFLDSSLKESIYEGTPGVNPFNSPQNKGVNRPLSSSMKDNLNVSYSSCKDLSKTLGVKLAVKVENGKVKFVSIPNNNNGGGDKLGHSAHGFETITEKDMEEKVDESIQLKGQNKKKEKIAIQKVKSEDAVDEYEQIDG